MELTFLGHSSFKLKGKEGVVLTDPFNPAKVGFPWSKPKADIVTVSHQHDDHNYVEGVGNAGKRAELFVIQGPGEYEVGGILVHGWQTDHDDKQGAERGRNTIYLIEVDRVKVLHCGDLGHELSEELIEELGQIDVMMVPVGGVYTIDAKTAVKIARAVSPSYVIPMHYQVSEELPKLPDKLEGVEEFLKQWGKETEPREKLMLSEGGAPEGTEVVVLKV